MSKKTGSQTDRSCDTEELHSLWTAPRKSGSSPIKSARSAAALERGVSRLKVSTTEDDRTKSFRTPVTPDVLSQSANG